MFALVFYELADGIHFTLLFIQLPLSKWGIVKRIGDYYGKFGNRKKFSPSFLSFACAEL